MRFRGAPPSLLPSLLVLLGASLLTGCGDPWWSKLGDKVAVTTVRSEQFDFDGAAWSSPPSGAMPAPSTAETGAVLAGSSSLVVLGGGSAQAFRYRFGGPIIDPGWEAAPSLPEARLQTLAVALGSLLCVASGFTPAGVPAFVEVLDDAAPAPGAWTRVPTPFRRVDAAVVATGTALLVIGGRDETGAAKADIWKLDPVTTTATSASWALAGVLSTPRVLPGAFVLGSKVHVVSGAAPNGSLLATEEVFDAATGAVLPPVAVPTARLGPEAVVIDGRAFLLDNRARGVVPTGRLDSFKEGDSPTGWLSRAPAPAAHLGPAAAAIAGKIALVGGYDGHQSSRDVFVFDPATGQWGPGPGIPERRHGGLLVPLGGTGTVSYLGGYETREKRRKLTAADFFGL